MKKAIIALSLCLLFVGLIPTNFALAQESKDILTMSSWVKSAVPNSPWQESVKGEANQEFIFRFDIKNVSNATVKDIYVDAIIAQNLIYMGDLVVDNQSSDIILNKGIYIGELVPNRTKIVTFKVKVAPVANLMLGQNELVVLFQTTGNIKPAADISKVFVWKTGVAGTSIGPVVPSSLNTGLKSSIFDFIILPFLLALLCVVAFRHQILAMVSQYEVSIVNAKNLVAKKTLQKKIEEIK